MGRRPRRKDGEMPSGLADASLLEALRCAGTKRGRHKVRLALNSLAAITRPRRTGP